MVDIRSVPLKRAIELTRGYLTDPATAAGLNPRQTDKLENGLRRARQVTGWSRRDTIDYIISTAVLRLRHARPTLYINNIGSSGSHWLNAMLKSGAGLMGTGEMYVPLEFLTGTVAACATEHRPVFLQSVYLAHLMTGAATDVEDHISNTAHVADLSPYAQNDIHCLKILLIRNPADVAISRTLRKTEYRSYLRRTEVSDQAYLRENIRKVDLFYRTVSRDNYDLVCRYEDLVADPVPILEAVGALLGLPLDREMLRKIAGETKAKETPDQDLSEERRLQYAPVIDAFRREAADALREVSETLGYG